jgi:hypothetical protein
VAGGPLRPGAQLADQALPCGLLVELGDVLRSELLGQHQVHLVLLQGPGVLAICPIVR